MVVVVVVDIVDVVVVVVVVAPGYTFNTRVCPTVAPPRVLDITPAVAFSITPEQRSASGNPHKTRVITALRSILTITDVTS